MANEKRIYKKDVSDAEVAEFMAPAFKWLEQLVEPRVKMEEEKKPESQQKQKKDRKEKQETKRAELKLDEKQKDLLTSVFENPNYGVNRHANTLGFSPYTMNKMKKSLMEKGLIEEIPINLNRGGIVKFLELTDQAYGALGKKPRQKPRLQCSKEHWWWQCNIAASYRKMGYQVQIEMLRGNKHADVGVVHNGKVMAIEVELTSKNAVVNVKENLQNGFDRVRVACRNTAVKQEAERALQSWQDFDTVKEKVEVCLLTDFSFIKEFKKG